MFLLSKNSISHINLIGDVASWKQCLRQRGMSWVRIAHWVYLWSIVLTVQYLLFFLKTIINPKCNKSGPVQICYHMIYICKADCGSRTPGSGQQDVSSPSNSATSATSWLHFTILLNLWTIYTFQFYYSANEWDWTKTIESGCVPKNSQYLLRSCSDFHHGNPSRYDYVAKTTRDVELENDIVWKLVVSRPRLAFSDTLDEFFKFKRTWRVTAESAGALRDGANVVRTETGNYFCVRICYKFLISDCKEDWDLGLCTSWVLAKREPLSKSDFWKKMRFRPQKKLDIAIAQRIYKRQYPKSAQT